MLGEELGDGHGRRRRLEQAGRAAAADAGDDVELEDVEAQGFFRGSGARTVLSCSKSASCFGPLSSTFGTTSERSFAWELSTPW
jgi:hypothetical protein